LLFLTFLGCDSSGSTPTPVVVPPVVVPPVATLSDDELMDVVPKQTFNYFWTYAETTSGMARERYLPVDPAFDQNIVTTGGSGFGLMAIVSAMSRSYITKIQGVERLNKIADFLASANRFHGAWSHWIMVAI
jgi:hypothetical protein